MMNKPVQRRLWQVSLYALTFSLVLAAAPGWAQGKKPEVYFDHENQQEDEKIWQEKKAELPAYPRLEKLQPVYVSSAVTLEYALDPASLQVGADNVVRYTLVIKSRSGAINVSFEGLRCESMERKLYALGHPTDSTWSVQKNSQWKKLNGSLNPQQMALFSIFCPNAILLSADPKILLNALKSNRD